MLKIRVPACSFAEFGQSSPSNFFNSIFITMTSSENVVQPRHSLADLEFQWACRLVFNKSVSFLSCGERPGEEDSVIQ
jgi:hypothetical protein